MCLYINRLQLEDKSFKMVSKTIITIMVHESWNYASTMTWCGPGLGEGHGNLKEWAHLIITDLHWWSVGFLLNSQIQKESPSSTQNCETHEWDVPSDVSNAQETTLRVDTPDHSRNLLETLSGAHTHTLRPNRKPLFHSVVSQSYLQMNLTFPLQRGD